MDYARFCRWVVFRGVAGINNVIFGAVRALYENAPCVPFLQRAYSKVDTIFPTPFWHFFITSSRFFQCRRKVWDVVPLRQSFRPWNFSNNTIQIRMNTMHTCPPSILRAPLCSGEEMSTPRKKKEAKQMFARKYIVEGGLQVHFCGWEWNICSTALHWRLIPLASRFQMQPGLQSFLS